MVDKAKIKIEIRNLSVFYGSLEVLKGVNLDVEEKEILAVIGPANSGKTSLLRTLNRLNERNEGFRMQGEILLDGRNIYKKYSSDDLRRVMGMIFALPVSLPLSIYDNIAYGPRLHGVKKKSELDPIVRQSLEAAFLWEEVKDRLNLPAMKLSGGQQQRLCIARTLAIEPEVILYDEPCSGLDPVSTTKVEEAMRQLKNQYTQILVTNNTKQAARVSDRTAFFLMGELIEIDRTEKIFTAPRDQRTDDYVTGRFG
ncbi:MAG: phosphate ABC transporter ATP-binding protein [Candidatus Omnitrophica bacterium]|nr:phosphate ABC transporter ATP-binding protein [Candidatus Omnitrophota bacterium]